VAEVASAIGVSEKPVRAAIKRGELRAYNFGARLTMVPQEEFDRWRESRQITPARESNKEAS
jgi:excisionase family DNA binding protein